MQKNPYKMRIKINLYKTIAQNPPSNLHLPPSQCFAIIIMTAMVHTTAVWTLAPSV